MSFIWGPFKKPIDTFEDNDLSEYDLFESTEGGSATTQDSVVKEGEYALKMTGDQNSATGGNGILVTSDSGLDNYLQQTETASFWFRLPKKSNVEDRFEFETRFSTFNISQLQVFVVAEVSGGDITWHLRSHTGPVASLSSDTWYKMIVKWNKDRFDDPDDSLDTYAYLIEDSSGDFKGGSGEGSDQLFVGEDENDRMAWNSGQSDAAYSMFCDHAFIVDEITTAAWTRTLKGEEIAKSFTEDFTDEGVSKHGTIDQWYWDFGDGNTSTNQNPSHSYGAIGNFTVEHKTKDDLDFEGPKETELVTVVEELDDFEDGSISEYSGITSAYSVSSNAANHRDNGLESDPNQNSGEIFDTDVTVQQGDNISADLRVQNDGGVAYFLFGVQNNSNYYTVFIDHENQETKLQRIESNTSSPIIDSTSMSFDTGQWFTAQIQWGSSGGFIVDLLLNNSSNKATLTGTDTGFTSGGIGWRADNDQCYFDFARILANESLR